MSNWVFGDFLGDLWAPSPALAGQRFLEAAKNPKQTPRPTAMGSVRLEEIGINLV